jgi:Spy/CpxP family protein refolding chaperone
MMKKLTIILGAAMVLTTGAFAQTAADVEATDALNHNAEIKIVEHVVKVSEVGDDAVKIEETVIVTEVEPNIE